MPRPFHLAIPVHDLEAARAFYEGLLGCRIGRADVRWIDFDFFGHQVTAHLCPAPAGGVTGPDGTGSDATNPVDDRDVPVRHFGVILEPGDWSSLAGRLVGAGVEFLIEPTTRFAGTAGQQSTMFLRDPSGNALEFKAFASDEQIFRPF